MPIKRLLPWQDPLQTAYALAKKNACFACLLDGTNGYSYLAWQPRATYTFQTFSELNEVVASLMPGVTDRLFGYLGYEMKHDCEQFEEDPDAPIQMPRSRFTQFACVLVFDPYQQQVEWYTQDERRDVPSPLPLPPFNTPPAVTVSSTMTKEQYIQRVKHIKEHIWNGDCFQANLTRKVYGKATKPMQAFEMFQRLYTHSPTAYNALLQWPDVAVVSASPEQFLAISEDGEVVARPIKGSIARGATAKLDQQLQTRLRRSHKDGCENRMIVDLMRNDLSKTCKVGSVQVPHMCDLESYSYIHHLVSTICGLKLSHKTVVDTIKGCFPPGSMTGAPKHYAMKLCSQYEGRKRGVYSGSLGWLGPQSCHFSVVIRTLVLQQDQYEFQVGGGIVADSDPESEWQETLTKASALMAALGLCTTDLIF